jgi:hypothetical protein
MEEGDVSVVTSKEQELEKENSRENGSMPWELEEGNGLVNTNSAEVNEGAGPIDTSLDTGSEKLVPRTNTLPLDIPAVSQTHPLSLDQSVTSQKVVSSPMMLPRVPQTFPPPLNFSNGLLPPTPLSPRISQGQLDASATVIQDPSITCSNIPTPKTIFPPFPTSSKPSITTTCMPSPILNLEDKVLFGPDSNVSGPITQKPKRKTVKPYWIKDYVSK